MKRRIRSHATYANVMASIAVFVAIGGTSYAAIALPRNSVGKQQIKPDAVGSSELRTGAVRSRAIQDGTIRTSDLTRATRQSLAGAPGPAGPPGPAAVGLRATVNSAGESVAGNATGSEGAGSGKRLIAFSRSLAGCVPVASLSKHPVGDNPDPGPGHIVASIEGDWVSVETYNASGARAYLPFNLIVTC